MRRGLLVRGRLPIGGYAENADYPAPCVRDRQPFGTFGRSLERSSWIGHCKPGPDVRIFCWSTCAAFMEGREISHGRQRRPPHARVKDAISLDPQRVTGAKDAAPGEGRLGARAAAALWMMGPDFSFRYFSKASSVFGSLANRVRASVRS